MYPTFENSIVSTVFNSLKQDVDDIQNVTTGPCKILTNNTKLLYLRSTYLYKTYFAFTMKYQQFKEFFVLYKDIMKMVAIINGFRSLDIYVYSVESFFQLIKEFNHVSSSQQINLQIFNIQLFEHQKQLYLEKSENIDRVMSGLIKCNYYRDLSPDIVQEVEIYSLQHVTNEADKVYIQNIFQQVYGLFEYNLLYNMQMHKLQPVEVVLSIMFFLDEQKRKCVSDIVDQYLKVYGDNWNRQFMIVEKVSENILKL